MKRDISITGIFGAGKTTGTIVIDKDGMRVENKSPSYTGDNEFIREHIPDCINMDEWQHSWHLDVSEAKSRYSKKGRDTRKNIRDIMLKKITLREDEIKALKDGLNILGRWHY